MPLAPLTDRLFFEFRNCDVNDVAIDTFDAPPLHLSAYDDSPTTISMTVAILILVYLVALTFSSIALHRRCGCVVASFLAGFIAAFLATSVFVVLEERSTDPKEYVATFWYGGISLWIASAVLSCLIGLPIQKRKPNKTPQTIRTFGPHV